MPGPAARFWTTSKLLRLARDYGIDRSNVAEHFAPEPPSNPLALKDYATGRGRFLAALILCVCAVAPARTRDDGRYAQMDPKLRAWFDHLASCRGDLRRVRAPRFRAGGMVLFIPWRGGAERGAGLSPSWRPRRRRFLFGFIGWWPARPSHGVSFADGGLATTRW
jgi:hypothetical protein